REDERLTPTHFPATFHEGRELAALQLEGGTAEQVQSRLGGGGTHTPRRAGCVSDVQAATGVGAQRAARGDSEAVRDVAVDLPVMQAHAGWRAGEEVVERDDAVERCLGKQGLKREHAPGADPEVDVAAPIELRGETRTLPRSGGRAGGRAPPARGRAEFPPARRTPVRRRRPRRHRIPLARGK